MRSARLAAALGSVFLTLHASCCNAPPTIEFIVVDKSGTPLDSVVVRTSATVVPLEPLRSPGSFQGHVAKAADGRYELDVLTDGGRVRLGECVITTMPRGPIIVLVRDVTTGDLKCAEGGS